MMSSRLRKLGLTAHVTVSVGWLGAVASFLALAVAALSSQDAQLVRAFYLAMGAITWWVIVPASLLSLLTGIVQSLGTPWGLFRYYWVVVKLVLTVLATLVLLIHTQPIDTVARAAGEASFAVADLGRLRLQLVLDATAALVVLLLATILSVYKPPGLTPYGWRKRFEQRVASEP
jgi:hypothetical protein